MSRWYLIFTIVLVLVFLAPPIALVSEGMGTLRDIDRHVVVAMFERYGLPTLQLVVLSVLGALLMGLSSAYLCARYEFPLRRIVLWLSLLPLAVPSYLVAYAWIDHLVDLGVPGGRLRTPAMTALIFAVCLSPYVFLPSYRAFVAIPRSLVESARLLGRSPVRSFFSVEMPLVWPSVFVGAALVGMEVLADFGTVDFMAVDTWSTGIFRSWFGLGDRARAAFLALILFAGSGVFLLWQLSANARKSIFTSSRSIATIARKKTALIKLLPLVVLALLSPLVAFVMPIFILIQRSWRSTHSITPLELFAPAWTTLWVAVVAGALIVLVGFFFAMSARLTRGHRTLSALVRLGTLGYAFPGGVLGVGLIILLAHFSLTGTLFGLFFAYVIRFVTIGANAIETGWQAIPVAFVEQARLLGSTPLNAFVRVELPLLKRSVACAFALGCIDVIKELPATMLLMPLNFETLALKTYNLASDERLAETAPFSLVMIVVCGFGVFVSERMGAFDLAPASETKRRATDV